MLLQNNVKRYEVDVNRPHIYRSKGGLTDVWILTPDFTLHEQPNLSRSGVGKPSPVLDQGKLDLLRGKTIQVLAFERRHTSDQSTQPNETTYLGTFSNSIFYHT
ncbi:hypothetical protein DPMN_055115 [Dreissena polymorpha]|uniref:Uncharacterized protein n=1 Tax=Dreissena polymorpha TaxID=45954 RepID=A0A9D4CQ65_DREPO|nr:hypothetical protein DPMN_055115 [Dreissena polymorpha]